MRRHNKYRLTYFKALLDQARKQALQPQAEREIVRRPGNPMLRYAGAAGASHPVPVPSTPNQETLDL
jgi:hypothetical protein